MPKSWLAVAAALAVLLGPPGAFPGAAESPSEQASPSQSPAPPSDPKRLEVIEEVSESLANDLLDLSLATRDRDDARAAEFFPAELEATPFPSRPLPLEPQVKWIGRHQWGSESAVGAAGEKSPRRLSREAFLRDWFDFLGHFAEIEDARFKVKGAMFDASADAVLGAKVPTATVGSSGQARVAFYVIGRDLEGRREWVRGTAETRVRRGANELWLFDAFVLTSLESVVASTDLFSEVALPAGVGATRPAYGTPGNTGYVWQGAAAADFNNDTWLDLFVTGPQQNTLYLNNGAGRFRDVSEEVGLVGLEGGVAPVAFDYDNDGDLDIFISAVGPQMLLENRLVPEGRLVFRDISTAAGVAVVGLGFSATVGDVNADGWPDVYVACYNHYGRVMPNSWYRATNGTPNLLLLNLGNGRFREEAARWGVDDSRWSYAAAFADVNADGRLDLYVANDFGENGLFIHHGDHFVDEAAARGVLDPGYGMGVAFGDYNNDGRLDLHVTNMSSTAGNRILSRLFPRSNPKESVLIKLAAGNNLYENLGEGAFRDVTAEAGPFSAGWAWGGGFLDFDNDGWEDLYTTNGFISGKSMKDT